MVRARWRRRRRWVDAAEGALAGLVASWVMEEAQRPIQRAGSAATRRREEAARGEEPPATVRAAEAIAELAGRRLATEAARKAGGEAVHYLTGAAWGAFFGALAPRLRSPPLLSGAAFGALVWLVNDEGLVPLLGFAKGWSAYPRSVHAKALASHLVYGAATAASFRAIDRALR